MLSHTKILVNSFDRFATGKVFSELKRIANIHARLPSEALRIRTKELLASTSVSENSFLDPRDTIGLVLGVCSLDLDLRDRLAVAALHHIKVSLSNSDGYGGIQLIRTCIQLPGRQTDFKVAVVDAINKSIQTLTTAEFVKLILGINIIRNINREVLGCIAEHAYQIMGGLAPKELTLAVIFLSERGIKHKELLHETEKAILSGQLTFKKFEVEEIIKSFRKLGTPTLNLQLHSNTLSSLLPLMSLEPKSTAPPPRSTAGSSSVKDVEFQPAGATSGLSLTQRLQLEQQIASVLPSLPLEDIITVLSSARQKGADTEAITTQVCNAVSRCASKNTPLPSKLTEEITFLLLGSPLRSSPALSYVLEDTIAELFSTTECTARDPTVDATAVKQLMIVNEAVSMFPRLASTPLAKALLTFISTIGQLFERVLDTDSNLQWKSLPPYAYHAVKMFVSCNATHTLDVNRKGIGMALQGLSASRAASLLMVTAHLKCSAVPDIVPLNMFLSTALVSVLHERGTDALTPALACQAIEGMATCGAKRIALLLKLHAIVVNNMRRSLDPVSGVKNDVFSSVRAVGHLLNMFSSARDGKGYKAIKFGVADTVNIMSKTPDVGVSALAEGLRILTVLTTCEAEIASYNERFEQQVKLQNTPDSTFREFRKSLPPTQLRMTASASEENKLLIENIARKLRATMKNATAAETVTVLHSLSLLRPVPQLQKPLIQQDLPICAIRHATTVLASAPPKIVSGLVAATENMNVPEEVIAPFRSVCAKALVDSLDREAAGTSEWSNEVLVTYARAAHHLSIHAGTDVLAPRFGKVLWDKGSNFVSDTSAIDDVALFASAVAFSVAKEHLRLTDTEKKRFETVAKNKAESCSVKTLALLVGALINLGYPNDEENPLCATIIARRQKMLESSEAMTILRRHGIDRWVDRKDTAEVAVAVIDNEALKNLLKDIAAFNKPVWADQPDEQQTEAGVDRDFADDEGDDLPVSSKKSKSKSTTKKQGTVQVTSKRKSGKSKRS